MKSSFRLRLIYEMGILLRNGIVITRNGIVIHNF
jgi:hypothetical protein